MTHCEHTLHGIDWQFQVYAGSEVANESPLMSLYTIAIVCEYDWQADRVTNVPEVDPFAMYHLFKGQEHSEDARNHYQHCRNEKGFWDFYLYVTRCVLHRTADFNEVRGHITWQNANNPGSISDAKRFWALRNRVTNPAARSLYEIDAIYSLLVGQRHNPDSMRLYRACWRDDPEQLMRIVSGMRDVRDVLERAERGQQDSGSRSAASAS